MMTPRTDCIEGFEKLKDDIDDLDSVNFREHWFYRARALLREHHCSYRYGILMRLAESHMHGKRSIWDRLGKEGTTGIDRITSIPFRDNGNSNSTRGKKQCLSR